MEQYYDYPNSDPFYCDNNPTFRRHSWVYYQGQWIPWEPWDVYVNVMLRVYVETGHTFPGVQSTSIGRVKALYY